MCYFQMQNCVRAGNCYPGFTKICPLYRLDCQRGQIYNYSIIHVNSIDKDMNGLFWTVSERGNIGCNFLRYLLSIYPFVAAVMNSQKWDSKNRRFMVVIPCLRRILTRLCFKSRLGESNLGGTTGAIARPFAGRAFFVCVDISVSQNLKLLV